MKKKTKIKQLEFQDLSLLLKLLNCEKYYFTLLITLSYITFLFYSLSILLYILIYLKLHYEQAYHTYCYIY